MNILSEIEEIAIDPIIAEAKEIAGKAVDFLKETEIAVVQKAVAFVKETSLGTAIENLISAVDSSDASGADKFEAVVAAAEKAYQAFVDNGGLSGLLNAAVSILRQLVQMLYDNFKAAFFPTATAA